jgi:hypothetical protein
MGDFKAQVSDPLCLFYHHIPGQNPLWISVPGLNAPALQAEAGDLEDLVISDSTKMPRDGLNMFTFSSNIKESD